MLLHGGGRPDWQVLSPVLSQGALGGVGSHLRIGKGGGDTGVSQLCFRAHYVKGVGLSFPTRLPMSFLTSPKDTTGDKSALRMGGGGDGQICIRG
jgi:hypothetical protein